MLMGAMTTQLGIGIERELELELSSRTHLEYWGLADMA